MLKIVSILIISFLASEAFALSEEDFKNQLALAQKKEDILELAQEWLNSNDFPQQGKNGRIEYLFGTSIPVLICRPLTISQIELEAGEKLTQAPQIGDSVRWHIAPSKFGVGSEETICIMVKPVEANLETNLTIATDRRTYTIALISDEKKYTPKIGFNYPDTRMKLWKDLILKKQKEIDSNTIEGTGENITSLDFNYHIKGFSKLKPERVYSNGSTTIIDMGNKFNQSMPTLLVVNESGSQGLVNYRMKDNKYIVDKVLDKAILFSGVGNNRKQVTIKRVG